MLIIKTNIKTLDNRDDQELAYDVSACICVSIYDTVCQIVIFSLLQANDKRTKNWGRFNIKIMHFSQEKAQGVLQTNVS